MDFRFNVNGLLPKKINKITHTLIPEGFRGDRREYNECQRLLTRILDDMGEASAKAQGLNRTITSAIKLRDTDHIIYLMVDSAGNNGLGSVVGLLKTGSKMLFMFDENGLHYQVKPRCILDFYIHESRQRMGLGNELYQFMLSEENLKPIKLAIDRPSDKFLAFLKKHYGLSEIISQNNKFVVFKGFFADEEESQPQNNSRFSESPSPNRQSTEHKIQSNNNVDVHSIKNNSINGTSVSRSAYGRYAASRPPCSMANIIHNTAGDQPAERTSDSPLHRFYRSRSATVRVEMRDRPGSLKLYIEENDKKPAVQDDATSVQEDNGEVERQAEAIEQISLENSEHDEVKSNDGASIVVTLETNGKEVVDEGNGDDTIDDVTSEVDNQEGHTGGHLDLKFYHSPLW